MTNNKFIKFSLISLLLLYSCFIFANDNQAIDFFASNNTKKINIETAYQRLIGVEQLNLQNEMMKILQEEHIAQGRFEDILGSYFMVSDNKITADNSERFSTSPYQSLSEEKIFKLARKFAIKLNQESIAVVIPNPSTIGEISVNFTSHYPSIKETIQMIHDRLPAVYSQAYSLHLGSKCNRFNNAKVTDIEWLGSQVKLYEIKKAFPAEKVNYQYGKVYLVYKNGQHDQI